MDLHREELFAYTVIRKRTALQSAAAAYHRQYPGIRPDRKNTRQSGCFIDRCDARENMGILT